MVRLVSNRKYRLPSKNTQTRVICTNVIMDTKHSLEKESADLGK